MSVSVKQGKVTYRAGSLPGAPKRKRRAKAEADELRGIELQAYLALLPELTGKQWIAARSTQVGTERSAAHDRAFLAASEAATETGRRAAADAAWDAVLDVVELHADTGIELLNARIATMAIVARDHISIEHFDVLTAPMKVAGIDFDNLVSKGDRP